MQCNKVGHELPKRWKLDHFLVMCHVSDVVAEGISIMIFRDIIDKPRGGFASLLENGMTLMPSWV